MFGRSGQMFPRRTFHDAIYEEEYGSDNEDECCRCRGLSAILCWFLSVIILVGLAATVVLTVFFILRSRTMIVKPDGDLDVEMYGKDQNIFDSGGVASKELIGSNESSPSSAAVDNAKRKKSKRPPDATKNDVDADVNEEQNAINDSEGDQAENASVNHPRNPNPNRGSKSSASSTTTSTTTEPSATEEEEEGTSEETENDQNNGEGSSLFNLFSGPRNPSYNTPHHDHDEFTSKEIRHHHHSHAVISAESSETRYDDGSPVQQVLFTESPKVTVTTPNPHNRRNLQTTRFPTGRTSFSSTTTTTAMPPTEESAEEEADGAAHHHTGENDEDEEGHQHNDNEDEEEEGDDDEAGGGVVTQNDDESSREDEHGNDEGNHDDDNEHNHHDENEGEHNEKSSEEDHKEGLTTVDPISGERESEMGSQSGESKLKEMLLDEIPPHVHGQDKESGEAGGSTSAEFDLTQKKVTLTTTTRPTTTTTSKPTKPSKNRQDTLTRIISRNFTRNGNAQTTTEISTDDTTETATNSPVVTTLGPAGHKYDYTMTPHERTKLKVKSAESSSGAVEESEEEEVATKPPPKFRYRSTTTTPKSTVVVTPEPPSTAAPPRTRGTTPPSNSQEFGMKLGGKRGSVESPIDIIPSPDLSPKGQLANQNQNSAEGVDLNSGSSSEQDNSKTSEQFMDVLVGDKTLVTKKTEDGIVTSAILPPWFDTNGGNNASAISDVLTINGTVPSNVVAKVKDNSSAEKFGKKTKNNKIRSSEERTEPGNKDGASKEENVSEFDRLVNSLSKQVSSEEAPPSRFGYKKPKPIVLKKPGQGLLNPASRYIPQVPGRANLFPTKNTPVVSGESSNKPVVSTENNKSASPTPSGSPEEEVQAEATNVDEDVGRTGVPSDVAQAVQNGYYPDDNTDSDRVVEQHLIESERLSSDEIDSIEPSPSHVIDVNFEEPGDNPTEVIIEQDSSAPVEDEAFVDDDYGYGDDPPTMAMAGSTPTKQIVPAPVDYTRGSGVRKPMSSEEVDMDPSASTPEESNVTSPDQVSATTTLPPPVVSTTVPGAAIRRPAYTREQIAKASVKPSPDAVAAEVSSNNVANDVNTPVGSGEVEASEEYEEYEDDNYEGGSVEQPVGGSVEQHQRWSSEKLNAQKWSEPDKMGAGTGSPNNQQQQNFINQQGIEEHHSEENVGHPQNNNNIGSDSPPPPVEETQSAENSTIFRPPQPVSFHENKLSFSPPVQADGEYHSKDGWRPVLSGSSPRKPTTDQAQGPFYNGGVVATSQEANSGQTGSFEPEQHESEQQHEQFQQPQPLQQQITPPQWANEANPPSQPQQPQQDNGKLKPSPLIPPPVPATVKFPDSEEDHEDRHHHGRNKLRHPQHLPINNFDRAKYMVRPVPPPIVMRRHPHSTGPFPPHQQQGPPPPPPPQHRQNNPQQPPQPIPHNRQPPPPPPQRQPIIPQASQPNPQFAEHPQQRPQVAPLINRNFHMRPNPMRRFNFGGGPPQAQPRSGGNIKWPSEEDTKESLDRASSQSETNKNSKRRRRRRALG